MTLFPCLCSDAFFPVVFEVEEALPQGLKAVIPISGTETEVKIHVGWRVKDWVAKMVEGLKCFLRFYWSAANWLETSHLNKHLNWKIFLYFPREVFH